MVCVTCLCGCFIVDLQGCLSTQRVKSTFRNLNLFEVFEIRSDTVTLFQIYFVRHVYPKRLLNAVEYSTMEYELLAST